MKWLDRRVERLFAKPDPFDCGWCAPDGDHGRHDMCTGSAVRPHREGSGPAAVTECACALRQHNRAVRPPAPEEGKAPAVANPFAVPESTPAGPGGLAGAVDVGSDPYRHVPRPPMGAPEERRRERDRRRRNTAVKGLLPAAAIVIVLAVASQCEGGGSQRIGAPGGPVAEPAVWEVDPDRPPQTEARSFTALVSRVGCGEVGDVRAPQVLENPSSVTVIFTVPPATTGGGSGACAMDAAVPYSVRLAAPLGQRALFDGTCDLPPVSTTDACVTAQRWPSQP